MRDDEDVPLVEVVRRAALDRLSADLVRCSVLRINNLAARDKCRASFDDVEDIRIERVNFNFTWAVPPRRQHSVNPLPGLALGQGFALGKRCCHLRVRIVLHLW